MISKLRAREVSSLCLRDPDLKSSTVPVAKLPLSKLFPRLGSPAHCVVLGFSHDGRYILSLDHDSLRVDLFVNGTEPFNTRYLSLPHEHLLNHHTSLLHLTVQLITLPHFELSCTLCQNDDFFHLSIFQSSSLQYSEHIEYDLHSMSLWSTFTPKGDIDYVVTLSGVSKIWFYGVTLRNAKRTPATSYTSHARDHSTVHFTCTTPCVLAWYWNDSSCCTCPTCAAHAEHTDGVYDHMTRSCFDSDAFISTLYHHYFGSLDSSAKDFCVHVLGPDVDDSILLVITIAMEIYQESGTNQVLMGWVLSLDPWCGDIHVLVMHDLLYYLGISIDEMWQSLEKTTQVFVTVLLSSDFDLPSLTSVHFESYMFQGIGRQTFSRSVFYHPFLPILLYNDEETRL